MSISVTSSSYWVEGGRGCHFSFGQEGVCQKILYDVGGPGILKKIAPLKKYPLPLLQQYT